MDACVQFAVERTCRLLQHPYGADLRQAVRAAWASLSDEERKELVKADESGVITDVSFDGRAFFRDALPQVQLEAGAEDCTLVVLPPPAEHTQTAATVVQTDRNMFPDKFVCQLSRIFEHFTLHMITHCPLVCSLRANAGGLVADPSRCAVPNTAPPSSDSIEVPNAEADCWPADKPDQTWVFVKQPAESPPPLAYLYRGESQMKGHSSNEARKALTKWVADSVARFENTMLVKKWRVTKLPIPNCMLMETVDWESDKTVKELSHQLRASMTPYFPSLGEGSVRTVLCGPARALMADRFMLRQDAPRYGHAWPPSVVQGDKKTPLWPHHPWRALPGSPARNAGLEALEAIIKNPSTNPWAMHRGEPQPTGPSGTLFTYSLSPP